MKGGSAAFLATLAKPRKLVAVDIAEDEVEALEKFIEVHGLTTRVKPYYGVDQSDHGALTRIVEHESPKNRSISSSTTLLIVFRRLASPSMHCFQICDQAVSTSSKTGHGLIWSNP